ncbi:MAG: hypothetical protein P4L85_07590 [Paludisphaera borealis]|uniref:hypothetical protein n=1 Tax=Paludisphaera borealis TaxID=1387353 RepID=UPI0028512982|nr:hypothetical protein [Paludisphaera borealis]MDR3619197.1 hypothetical protein [Paludisphaera borealis]
MPTFDPDLDIPRASARNPYGESVAEYQRVLANPLLAVVGLVGAWAVLCYSLRVRNLPLFLIALILTALCPLLIQYHCLHCGRTDFAFRSRRHACTETLRRWRLGEPATRKPPRLRTQVKAWIWSLFVAVLIYAILAGGGR